MDFILGWLVGFWITLVAVVSILVCVRPVTKQEWELTKWFILLAFLLEPLVVATGVLNL